MCLLLQHLKTMENSNKDLKDNYIFGTDFGTDSFYIVSLLENYLSGVFPWPHLDFCDKCNHGLIHSNTLQLLMNVVVYV